MLQLELDPRYLQSEHAIEIEARRSNILRKKVTGGNAAWRKNRFVPISMDTALTSLLIRAYGVLGRENRANTQELDLLSGQALKHSLPYLQGEKGNFESFFHFKSRMFMHILRNMVIDRYRNHGRRLEEEKDQPDHDLVGRKVKKAEGFQPTLFRLIENKTKEEKNMDLFLADLQNPDSVLRSDYVLRLPRYRQRALELKIQNPNFSGGVIVQILELEGFRKFTTSAIRVWLLRAKKAQKNS